VRFILLAETHLLVCHDFQVVLENLQHRARKQAHAGFRKRPIEIIESW
jgi:hypothetical protein